jgi:hypothetical protein
MRGDSTFLMQSLPKHDKLRMRGDSTFLMLSLPKHESLSMRCE